MLGSCLLFIALLAGFRAALGWHAAAASITFYIFVDIFSVILVEQFWSLANTVTSTEAGRRSYWFIGTGGLLGGVLGGATAAALLKFTPMETPDLLLSCAAILVITFLLVAALRAKRPRFRAFRVHLRPLRRRAQNSQTDSLHP